MTPGIKITKGIFIMSHTKQLANGHQTTKFLIPIAQYNAKSSMLSN